MAEAPGCGGVCTVGWTSIPEPVVTVETRLGWEETGSFGGKAGTELAGWVCAGAGLKFGCMEFMGVTTENGKQRKKATC